MSQEQEQQKHHQEEGVGGGDEYLKNCGKDDCGCKLTIPQGIFMIVSSPTVKNKFKYKSSSDLSILLLSAITSNVGLLLRKIGVNDSNFNHKKVGHVDNLALGVFEILQEKEKIDQVEKYLKSQGYNVVYAKENKKFIGQNSETGSTVEFDLNKESDCKKLQECC